MKRLKDSDPAFWTQQRIASLFNMTQGAVSQHMKILSFPEKIQEAIHKEDLPYTVALKRFGTMTAPQLERVSETIEKKGVKGALESSPGTTRANAGTTRKPRVTTGTLRASLEHALEQVPPGKRVVRDTLVSIIDWLKRKPRKAVKVNKGVDSSPKPAYRYLILVGGIFFVFTAGE